MLQERQIDQLDARIKELRVEFERFFNGALAVPPIELQNRIQRMLRHLRDSPTTALVDRFRLTQLEARYNSYCELYNRRLREREEGRAGRAAEAAAASRPDPEEGVVVSGGIRQDSLETLYAGLCRGSQAPRFDLDSFRTYIDRQAEAIRSKTGCRQVRFRLVDEGGRMKLKARPLKGDRGDNGGDSQ